MHPAVLPAAALEAPDDRLLEAGMGVADRQPHTSMPSTSLWPLAVMPTATITALEITCLRGGSRRCR